MSLIWWLLPAISGVVGLMLGFAGLGKLFRLQPFSGVFRLLFSVGFLGLAGVVALAGLNLQTYKRLTFERPVATITFAATNIPGQYEARMVYPGGETDSYAISGDEWELNARVVKFKAFSNLLGFDSVYRLDRLYGRYEDVARAAETNGYALSENPGLDVVALSERVGGQFGVEDARYGSAVYNPMSDGLSYDVFMTQTALIARPANDATESRLDRLGEPAPDDGAAPATIGDVTES
ncbi:MAG: hypothetical protein AAGJ29_00460 [Pseudomonadota bacterium]